MSWGFVAGAAIAAVGTAVASRNQRKAAETQAEAAEQAGHEQLAIAREQLAATLPLRQLARQQGELSLESQRSVLPSLRKEFGQAPLSSSLVQNFLKRGSEDISRNVISSLTPFGLEDSTVAGRAIGEGIGDFQTNVGFGEIQNRRNLGLSLAGLNPIPSTFGTAGLSTAAQLGSNAANFGFLGGQSTAAGQLGQGNTLGNFFGQLGGQVSGMNFSGTGQRVPIAQNTALSVRR